MIESDDDCSVSLSTVTEYISISPLAIIIMGVAGCGKTTIGGFLARDLACDFKDADDFHPKSNIDKMNAGLPLDDEDREPWLQLVRDYVDSHIHESRQCVVACSALKQSYRDILQSGMSPQIVFVYLKTEPQVVFERLMSRPSHFMKSNLLDSQFSTLEEPMSALTINASLEVAVIVARIRLELNI